MKNKIVLLILIIFLIAGCVKEEKNSTKVTFITNEIQTKSCLITNNFYSDQCIEGTTVITSLMDYVNVDYEFEMKLSEPKEFDYKIYEDTYIIIENEDKIIYEEKVDKTTFSDISDGKQNILINGTEKIYPKPYIEKIDKIKNEQGYISSKSYIKYIQKVKTTNGIKKDLFEVIIEPNGETIKVSTKTLT